MPEDANASQTAEQGPRTREEFFKQFLTMLRTPFVKSAAEGFFENIRQIESLVQMPFVMFSFLEVEDHFFTRFKSSVQEHWSHGMDYGIFLEEHYKRMTPFKMAEVMPDFVERTRKRFDEALAAPSYGPFLTSSMQVLYSAAISGSWTAFECLAADLWVVALNEYPLPLAQAALSSLDAQETGELSGKQIPVGLAAKYGFDLRHCLGTLLKAKFDFTSVTGIQKAYKVFVPLDDFVQKIFADPLLSELEATRHLIVHRASKVDEEYQKRTGSSLHVGTQLTFTDDKTARFARVSQMAGFGLLAFVNDWIAAKLRAEH